MLTKLASNVELSLQKCLTVKGEEEEMSKVRVTQVRSIIGATKRQRTTLQTLGLRRIRQSVVLEATSSVLGAIRKVDHLVEVVEL